MFVLQRYDPRDYLAELSFECHCSYLSVLLFGCTQGKNEAEVPEAKSRGYRDHGHQLASVGALTIEPVGRTAGVCLLRRLYG